MLCMIELLAKLLDMGEGMLAKLLDTWERGWSSGRDLMQEFKNGLKQEMQFAVGVD
jgi:hypothetical protein